VEALQEVSPKAAERVLRGEVREALTELPKVPTAVCGVSELSMPLRNMDMQFRPLWRRAR
jgi:hypothetical protein